MHMLAAYYQEGKISSVLSFNHVVTKNHKKSWKYSYWIPYIISVSQTW